MFRLWQHEIHHLYNYKETSSIRIHRRCTYSTLAPVGFGDMSQLLTSMFDSCRSWQAQSASLHGPAKAKMEEGQILCWNDRLVQKHRFFLICVCSLICQSKVFWYKMAVVALLVQCSAVRVQLDELRACFKLLFSTSESTSCCFCPLFWTA